MPLGYIEMNIKRLIGNVEKLKEYQKDKSYYCNWMKDGLAYFVYSLVLLYKPDVVVHTGFLWGKSSAFILEALNSVETPIESDIYGRDVDCTDFVNKNTPSAKAGKLIAVDPNIFSLDTKSATELLESQFDFEFYNMKSTDYFEIHSASLLNSYNGKTILGVVDGDHTDTGCMLDLVNLHNIGCRIMLVDDTSWLPNLNKVCIEFAEAHNYMYNNYDLYSGLGVLVKND